MVASFVLAYLAFVAQATGVQARVIVSGMSRLCVKVDSLVANITNSSDHSLILGAQLGAKPPNMHVDSSGSTEKVVPPYFLQKLLSGEHAPGVLNQKAEQFKFFIRQIQRGAMDTSSVCCVINDKFSNSNDVGIVDLINGNWPTGKQKPEARVNFDRRSAS